jgi:hypothetical protein
MVVSVQVATDCPREANEPEDFEHSVRAQLICIAAGTKGRRWRVFTALRPLALRRAGRWTGCQGGRRLLSQGRGRPKVSQKHESEPPRRKRPAGVTSTSASVVVDRRQKWVSEAALPTVGTSLDAQ